MQEKPKIDIDDITEEMLDEKIDETISSIMKDSNQLYDIYSMIVTEQSEIKARMQEVEEAIKQIIPQVDESKKELQKSRQGLVKASHKFSEPSEKSAYKTIESALAKYQELARKEAALQRERTALELKYKKFFAMGEKARRMVVSIGSVASFLTNQMRQVAERVQNLQGQVTMEEQVIQAHEYERLRVSRELQNTVVNDMVALQIETNSCKESVENGDKEDALEALDNIGAGLKESISNVREAIFDIRPRSLDLGLLEAVKELCEKITTRHGLTVELETDISNKDWYLPRYKQTVIYRLIKECINNILAHAENVNLAKVKIAINKKIFTAVVTDDGDGFDYEETIDRLKREGNERFGIPGMVEQAHRIGGEFVVTSENRSHKGARAQFRMELAA